MCSGIWRETHSSRGVLSLVNSIYDPLGLAKPVLLEGRLMLQQLVAMGKKTTGAACFGWDYPLPKELARRWQCCKDIFKDLQETSIRRCYHQSLESQRAIGAAIYLRLFNSKEDIAVFLMFGQAKVAPIMPTSIPRLKLCGAVLAAQAIDRTTSEMRAEGSTSMSQIACRSYAKSLHLINGVC